MNIILYFLLLVVTSFLFAKLEIQIEGKYFWASNLPTWKRKSRVVELLAGRDKPLTGYHLYLFLLIFSLLHTGYIFYPFYLKSELLLFSFFVFLFLLEDFLWIVYNPHFGLGKFNRENITWHREWFGRIPAYYIYGFILGAVLLFSGF